MKKRTAIITITYLTVFCVAFGAAALVQHSRAERYRLSAQHGYHHAFSELVTALSEIDTALQKSVYATSSETIGALCTDAFGKAMTAQMSLGVLPFSTQELEKTAGFISRVGDYTLALSRSAAANGSFSDDERQNLMALSEAAETLAGNLKNLQADISDGILTMDELLESERRLDNIEDGEIDETLGSSMRLMEEEFPSIPSLVYDGPFSEHLERTQPKLLEGAQTIGETGAREAASKFSGISRTMLHVIGKSEGKIPFYLVGADEGDGTMTIAVTEQGGRIMSMLSSHRPEYSRVSAEDALTAADEFLARQGYSSMARTYHIIQDNVLTVNYAAKQGDVLCYADLVEVAVALDTGKVCSFEATGYISSHAQRDIPEPAVSAEQASEKISPELEVLSHQLALIPSAGQNETLCHEFKCSTSDGQHFLVYVNAVTGQQHKILILIEDETGSLAI